MPFKTLIMSILCCYLTGIHLVFFLYIFLDNLFFEISTLVCDCSCVPLHNFDYVYDYLMETNLSFIDWYVTFALSDTTLTVTFAELFLPFQFPF
jgi:hypothetical protein